MRAKKYTGQTNNLRRRLREHNAPDNTSYTKGRKWRLLATRCFPDRSSALRYERQLKTAATTSATGCGNSPG
ncbi:MAG: GIY-YIG nuclease family protein [Planctomycetota bacterium]